MLRRTLSVCPSRYLSLPSVTWRHLANYNDTHVLFGSHRGPHIVRPSRPHKLVEIVLMLLAKNYTISPWLTKLQLVKVGAF